MDEEQQESKLAYPRIKFVRTLQEDEEGTQIVKLQMNTMLTDHEGNEFPMELIGYYPYDGSKDIETEMQFAKVFHKGCQLKFEGEDIEQLPDDFDIDDERY